MPVRFDSRPLVLRRAFTATMRATVVLGWKEHLSHSVHLFFVIASAVIARNVANQQVLDLVGHQVLGKLYLSVAIVTGATVAFIAWFGRNHDARKIAAVAHSVVAVTMGVAFVLPRLAPIAVGVYVVMEINTAVLLLGFALMLGARLGPRTARRVAARVGAGGILGGLAAGAVLSFGATYLGSRTLWLVAAALAVFPIFFLPETHRQYPTPQLDGAPRDRTDLPALASYGRWVAFTTFMMVATTTLVDYLFRAKAADWFSHDELTAFFGKVVFLAGVTSVVFQFLFLERLLDRLGIFSTALVMPGALTIAAMAFGLWSILPTLILLKLVDSGSNMSVQQATGGLLLAPLGARARAVWQGRIDGIAKRGGQAVTGVFLTAFPWEPKRVLPLTLVLCAVWIVAILVTRFRYVRLLTSMLSVPPAHDPELQAYDGATLRMLEGQLATATPARAAVILDLLEQAEHRASNDLLMKLAESDDRGALLVIDHLASLKDSAGLAEFARSRKPAVAGAALLALDDVDPAATDRCGRAVLAQADSAEELRALAAGVLSTHNPEARALVVQYGASPSPATRHAVAQALARLDPGGPGEIGATLCKLAADSDPEIARTALSAIGKHLSPEACDVALKALHGRRLRGAGMRALADLGPPTVPPIAEALASSSDPAVAGALIWALGRIGAAGGVPPLVAALASPHTSVRLSAAVALGALRRRRPDIELPLEQIEQHHVPEIQYYGRMREGALCGLPSTPAGIVLRRAFKQRGQAALETLFRLMTLSYPEDSIQAAFQAVTSRDRGQRQLGLELLDAVLASPTRVALAEAIGEGSRRTRVRDRRDILLDFVKDQDIFLSELAALVISEIDGVHPQDAQNKLRRRNTVSTSLVDQILELQAITLFSQASAEDLADVASLVTEQPFDKGEVIYREGEPGDALYLIRAGSVLLTRQKHKIDRLGPGDAFGIVSVLDRLPREQTATATTDCGLLVIKAADLQQLLADRPLLMHSVFRALTSSIRNQLDRVALGKKVAE